MPLELSEAAERDLDEILIYSTERFGMATAVAYVGGFGAAFALIERHPQAGQAVDAYMVDLRRLRHRRHRIFYEVRSDHVRVLRILHYAMSLDGRL